MVAKLSVQIALEGGKEIEQQLESISKAGQKVFNDINKAASKAGGFDKLDTGAVDKAIASAKLAGDEIEKVKKALADTAKLEKLVQALSLVDGAFNKLGLSARALLVALGPVSAIVAVLAVALGVGLVAAAAKAANSINKIDAEAIKLGVTIEQFSKLREAFQRAGISGEAFAKGVEFVKASMDSINLDKVQKALANIQQLQASGWASAIGKDLQFLQKMAAGFGPPAEAARAALAAIGQPFKDNVTPAFESMVRWAGSATQAIPLVAGELKNLQTAGERARFMDMLFKGIVSEAPDAVTGLENVVRAAQQMPDSLQRNKAIMDALGPDFGALAVQALRTGMSLDELKAKSEGLSQTQANTANQFVQATTAMAAALERLVQGAGMQTLNAGLADAATKMANLSWAPFNAGVTTASGSVDDLNKKLAQSVQTLNQINAGGGGGGGAPGLAGGGLMGGRGTGTSDSNLAWLSRGEHVMPARAVRQPGVLALLEALRRSGGNLSGVLDRLGGFALGGLVGPAAVPAFAGGGLNSMSHVTIAFPGLPAIGGLRASSAVVEELQRAAAMAQVRSGGRKPSRYS